MRSAMTASARSTDGTSLASRCRSRSMRRNGLMHTIRQCSDLSRMREILSGGLTGSSGRSLNIIRAFPIHSGSIMFSTTLPRIIILARDHSSTIVGADSAHIDILSDSQVTQSSHGSRSSTSRSLLQLQQT